jgi:hypothetical protein
MATGGGATGMPLHRRIEVAAAIAALILFLVAAISPLKGCSGGSDVKLEVDEITVANRPPSNSTVNGSLQQTAATEPTVEATVRNLGGNTAWIEEARITVKDVAPLPNCVYGGGGGEVPRTKPYRITLPGFPGVGRRTLRRELHVQVEPQRSARPVLAFQVRDYPMTRLFAIHVALVAAPSGRILDLGDFVLGVPGPPSRAGSLLPEDETTLTSEGATRLRLVSTWCYRHNLAAVRRLTRYPGKRSPYLGALANIYLAPGWGRYVDDRPAREAVYPLLHSDVFEAPIFAVFAAESSGDPELEGKARRQAASLLLRRARDGLDEYGRGAAADAETALSLVDSKQARTLLHQARIRMQAEEEELMEASG